MAPWSGSQGEPLDKAFYSLTDDSPGCPVTWVGQCQSEWEVAAFWRLSTLAPPAGRGSETKATPDL